jgi:hypothetical protein
MNVHDFWSLVGGILTIALVATILTKGNTASDLNAAGSNFTGALRVAEAGTG